MRITSTINGNIKAINQRIAHLEHTIKLLVEDGIDVSRRQAELSELIVLVRQLEKDGS